MVNTEKWGAKLKWERCEHAIA